MTVPVENLVAVAGGEPVPTPAPVVRPEPTDFLTRIALHPDMQPEKLTAVIDAWVRVQDYQAQREEAERKQRALEAYLVAKAAMQRDMKPVERATTNPHTRSRFANLGDLWAACAPVWGKHGFAVDFDVVETDDKQVRVLGFLSHEGGHVQPFRSYDAPPDTSGSAGKTNKTLIQGKQSTATYIQRNLLCRMVGIATVDDPADDDGGAGHLGGRDGDVGNRDGSPPPSPPSLLARGDRAEVERLVREIERQTNSADLEVLVDSVRADVDAAPEPVQQQIGRALTTARARLRRLRPFEFALLDAWGNTDGEVLLDAGRWVDAFLSLWDGAAKHPDEQAGLLEHNADALAAARRLGQADRLVDVKPRVEEGLFPGDAPSTPSAAEAEAWAQEIVGRIAPLERSAADFAGLQALVRDIAPKMRLMETQFPDVFRRVKHVCEAKWTAIKPEAASGK